MNHLAFSVLLLVGLLATNAQSILKGECFFNFYFVLFFSRRMIPLKFEQFGDDCEIQKVWVRSSSVEIQVWLVWSPNSKVQSLKSKLDLPNPSNFEAQRESANTPFVQQIRADFKIYGCIFFWSLQQWKVCIESRFSPMERSWGHSLARTVWTVLFNRKSPFLTKFRIHPHCRTDRKPTVWYSNQFPSKMAANLAELDEV